MQSGGIKHLVSMATSEHVIMQNEALVALALIAALELGKCPVTNLFSAVFIFDERSSGVESIAQHLDWKHFGHTYVKCRTSN